jgi:hypothetical protein
MLGVAGHVAAGGGLPAAGPVVLLTLLLVGVGVALAGRQRGLPAILATLSGTQLVLHVLLDALAHDHAAVRPVDPVAMVVLHGVAVVVTGVLLAGAERSVFAVGAVLAWLLRGVPVGRPQIGAWPCWSARPVAGAATGELPVLLRRVHGRRAPPVRF